jgi:hypothetical protein
MNERQRMEYLEAMGITQYVPRWILPAARLSSQLVLPATELESAPKLDVIEAAQPQNVPVAEPSPAPVAIGDLVETFVRQPVSLAEPSPVAERSPVAEASVIEAEPVAQFALSIWRPAPSLMIVDTRHAGQALPTKGLLDNILLAKEISPSHTKPDILLWPPAGGGPTPGWSAAREMLHAFLHARLERQPAQYLWLMGESACRAILPDHPYEENLGRAINLDSLATLAVVLPSLADMLLQPALKARTWAAIRSLHVR